MATAEELRSATEESTSRTVTVNGLRIHYNEVGSGDPVLCIHGGDPVLCIHGGGPGATGWSNFKQNITGLANDNRMLMLDLPGWGRSEYPDTTDEWLAGCRGYWRGFWTHWGSTRWI
ncbi:MAG: alpha/beta hydrolase [Chloroflexi bacterium]|nr:alpha/beta hydrolase [Chloroflexota bacterium]